MREPCPRRQHPRFLRLRAARQDVLEPPRAGHGAAVVPGARLLLLEPRRRDRSRRSGLGIRWVARHSITSWNSPASSVRNAATFPPTTAHWTVIAGFTIMNDWSARDLQRAEMAVGLGPSKGKDFATSLGPAGDLRRTPRTATGRPPAPGDDRRGERPRVRG